MKKIWLKWFAIGAMVAAPIVVALILGGDKLCVLAKSIGLLGFIASVGIACFTNFGYGFGTQVGWSHVEQQPFTIPPVKRPKVGGFVTGFAAISFVAYASIIFGLSV
jgi:hypothetical protein